MNYFLIQTSEHPDAGERIPTETADKSWRLFLYGKMTPKEARAAVDRLSRKHRHARCFRGGSLGKIHYAIYQGGAA